MDPKSHELRSKVLSLELLLGIVEIAGRGVVLRENPLFVLALKQYLCVALSKNAGSACTSALAHVFEISLNIFYALITYFKPHLKMQIQVSSPLLSLYFLDSLCVVVQVVGARFTFMLLTLHALAGVLQGDPALHPREPVVAVRAEDARGPGAQSHLRGPAVGVLLRVSPGQQLHTASSNSTCKCHAKTKENSQILAQCCRSLAGSFAYSKNKLR